MKYPIEKAAFPIIFMGSPDFAVPTLEALVADGWPVKAVVTALDKASGRGLKTRSSAVKQAAIKLGIPVLQPPNLKNEQFQEELRSYGALLQVVVAFRMLPVSVWDMPELGTINLHASMLPAYRGAAPIHWAVINGEKHTGLSTFQLQHKIDTGGILFQQDLEIGPDETTGELHDRMMMEGAGLILKTVEAIASGDAQEIQQDLDGDYPLAPKLHKADCQINWDWPAQKIHNFVRGLNPFPGAFTFWNNQRVRIHRTQLIIEKENSASAENGLLSIQNDRLLISCSDGFLEITELQLEGKKRMPSSDFLRGQQIGKGEQFVFRES
jgi:methionyl-tRNA formyltransferase